MLEYNVFVFAQISIVELTKSSLIESGRVLYLRLVDYVKSSQSLRELYYFETEMRGSET
jgi:hypothetical protein